MAKMLYIAISLQIYAAKQNIAVPQQSQVDHFFENSIPKSKKTVLYRSGSLKDIELKI